jgi:gamma-glutamyl-gamma-aminobutyrate hydrolase PuuD
MMKIAISMEMTRKLRDTWHAALNHEWYELLNGHEIVPISCHGNLPQTSEFDLIILAGGNDMSGIKTWRDNHYPLRDVFERSLIEQCWLTKTPVVGICRGAHFINWVSGGTYKLMDNPYDNVTVQLPSFEVTCHHTIRIDQLAPGFKILEQDDAGVVELAVNPQTRMLGIGWHPERKINEHTRTHILNLISTL